jgi:serine protease Do
MDEKEEEITNFDEPAIEDFFLEEEDPDRDRKKKRRKMIIRWVAGIVAFVFFMNSFTALAAVFNIPAFEFLKTSFQLSKREEIKQYKQAVVSIEGSNKKGTGFNVATDGYIITNFHVIEGMNPVLVYFPNGQVFKAKVAQKYPAIDLAFLDIKGKDLPILSLSENGTWLKGDEVFVIGNPLGYYQIANKGKVIGFTGVKNKAIPVLTISAPVFRGNSGSPVINTNGKVVGVVFGTTIPRVNKDETPVGLAIPIEEVLNRLP